MTFGIARAVSGRCEGEGKRTGDLTEREKRGGRMSAGGGARAEDGTRARGADGLRAARNGRETDVRPTSVRDHVAASILLCLPPSFAVLAVLILSPGCPPCQPVPLRRPLPPRPFFLTVMAEKDATARLRRAVKGTSAHLCIPAQV